MNSWSGKYFQGKNQPWLVMPGLSASPGAMLPAAEMLAKNLGGPGMLLALAGHDGSDYGMQVHWRRWLEHIEVNAEKLYERGGPIRFALLSTSGLLGICLASRRPELVHSLYLFNPAFALSNKWHQRLLGLLLKLFGDAWESRALRPLALLPVGTTEESEFPKYGHYSLISLINLVRLQQESQRLLTGVSCPIHCFLSKDDSLIDFERSARLLQPLSNCRLHLLEQVGHSPFEGPEAGEMLRVFAAELEAGTALSSRKRSSAC